MGKRRDAKKANKRRNPIEYVIKEYRETTDDWHPNWPGGKVHVSAFWDAENRFGRVCVWGMDDTGMERDFVDRESMVKVAMELDEVIMREDLVALGFRHG